MLDFDNKKVAVLGLGTEGIAVAKYLLENFRLSLTLLDRTEENQLLENLSPDLKTDFEKVLNHNDIKTNLGKEYLKGLDQYDVIFRTPGISSNCPELIKAKQSGTNLSSQIKLFFDLCPCPIIGVTGTKGKGTTSSLIYEMLKESKRSVHIAGNIGYPAIDLLKKLTPDDFVILELSSFQLMDLETSPYISVVTNLETDHLDYHADLDEYQTAKFNILKYQTPSDWAILNQNSTFSEQLLNTTLAKKKFFSKTEKTDCFVDGNQVIIAKGDEKIKICDSNEIKIFGSHNLENIAAATLVADILGVVIQDIVNATKSFKGLPHRIELVEEIKGVKYIDDSYATNPEPTKAAINAFKEDKVLILGGSSKGADFDDLAKEITKNNIKGVVLIGAEANKIKSALQSNGFLGQLVDGGTTIDEIVEAASHIASKGDIIILSPACASFGLFKNYKDRGEKFKGSVLKLKHE